MTDSTQGASPLIAAMRHLTARQQVIARNIANADTPGYRARELTRPDFAAHLGRAGAGTVARPAIAPTPAMLALGASERGGGSGGGSGRLVTDRAISEIKPDGNTVTLEDQVMKLGQIQAEFNAAAGLYAKQVALMRRAVRGA